MENKEALKKTMLTKDEAVARKAALSHPQTNKYLVNYDLTIALRQTQDKDETGPTRNFEGALTVSFNYYPTSLSEKGALFLNFWGEVIALRINGKECSPSFADKKLVLPHSNLIKDGLNEVNIIYHGYYTNRGCGLHHYTDPSDQKEYLYTQFEPFDCHLLFPCFDQPDIKATLKINLIAPDEWTVLSNESSEKPIKIADLAAEESSFSSLSSAEKDHLTKLIQKKNYTYTPFKKTPRISTYLFAVCAGPYHCIKNPFDHNVPMNIYMRDSLKNYGEIEEFFKITMSGMEFYKDYFGIAYPYSKYDQIFTPEYNFGAMENVGLVTYNEAYCWKDPPSQIKRSRFCITVLHELAHMWFGNLVTMKWWDDLWLNESFATFISFLAQVKGKGLEGYTNSWLSFNLSKGAAYREDQGSNTHPVYADVQNTEDAETHFDMITYYKGSSILKQLYNFIGFDNFSTGLKEYFSKYAWENTEFDQFIDSMTDAVNNAKDSDKTHDLKALCHSWLKKSGLTEIELNMQVDNNNILTGLEIKQTASLPEHNNLQTHKCNLLFVYEDGNKTLTGQIISPQTITNVTNNVFVGQPAPKAIIVNEGDHAYFKWLIDRRSLDYLRTNIITRVPEILSRQLFYRSLFDMVRDSRMSAVEYVEIVNELLSKETDYQLLTTSLSYVTGIVKNYIPLSHFGHYSDLLFDLIHGLLCKFINEKEYVLNLIDLLLSVSHSDEHYNYLRRWLGDTPHIVAKGEVCNLDKIHISQDTRFSIVKGLFKNRNISKEEKDSLLEKECELDKNSNRSTVAKHSCYASLPDPEVKKELWFKYINKSGEESLSNMRASMAHFASHRQIDLVKNYIMDSFFKDVVTVGKNNEHFYVEFFVSCFAPYYFISEEVIARIEELIKTTTDIKVLNKALVDTRDDMRRFLKAHKLCESFLSKK